MMKEMRHRTGTVVCTSCLEDVCGQRLRGRTVGEEASHSTTCEV